MWKRARPAKEIAMEKWEGLLEGAAKPLAGHLTLERVTASKSG